MRPVVLHESNFGLFVTYLVGLLLIVVLIGADVLTRNNPRLPLVYLVQCLVINRTVRGGRRDLVRPSR
jgi:hypothetical protein